MGKGRTVELALLLVSLSVAVLPACGPVADTAEGELCAPPACENGDCATSGQRILREGMRHRCTKQKASAAVDAGAPPATMPEDAAVFPCAICARADNCCKAQGIAGCAYTSACTHARTSDEAAFYSAVCRMIVESGPSPVGAVCGSR